MAISYTTDHLEGADRFAYWRHVICDAYLPIHCETPRPATFKGCINLDRLSDLWISHVSGSAQQVSRHRSDITRDADVYFMVSLQLSHRATVHQRDRTAELSPGDLALYSTSERYDISCPQGVDQLVLQIPQKELLNRVPHADLLTGHRIDGQSELGKLVSLQITQCAKSVGRQNEIVQRHMQDTIVDLVATGLSTLGEHRFELSRPKLILLSRAKSLIRSHLSDEMLDRQFLAQRLGVSARNLGRIFENDGTSIAAYIRMVRLEAIAKDLTDPRMAGQSISEIAFKWGMTNFQHFSSLFKQIHGMSPRDYRRLNST